MASAAATPSRRARGYLHASLRVNALLVAGVLGLVGGVSGFLWWSEPLGLSAKEGAGLLLYRAGLHRPAWIPEMVAIPPGEFLVGLLDDREYSDMRPWHLGTIERGFWMGRYEVTFDQYCVSSLRGCPSDQGWAKGSRPVIGVSWKQATAYVEWLAEATGEPFRLPSEAEWEYAARAGTDTRYWWGDEIDQDGKVWANCVDCGGEWDEKSRTAPVGSFAVNPFGLYDTAGNVSEWVQDCWSDNYDNGPTTAAAREKDSGGECGLRVLRGGSWSDDTRVLRSAYRYWFDTGNSSLYVGFRLTQDL